MLKIAHILVTFQGSTTLCACTRCRGKVFCHRPELGSLFPQWWTDGQILAVQKGQDGQPHTHACTHTSHTHTHAHTPLTHTHTPTPTHTPTHPHTHTHTLTHTHTPTHTHTHTHTHTRAHTPTCTPSLLFLLAYTAFCLGTGAPARTCR